MSDQENKQIEDSAAALQQKAKALLDEQADGLDAATLSRLHRSRSEAQLTKARPGYWQWWSGAAVMAAGLASVVIYFNASQPHEPMAVIYEDPVQQAASAEVELMDDLDFVAWLVLQESETLDAADQS